MVEARGVLPADLRPSRTIEAPKPTIFAKASRSRPSATRPRLRPAPPSNPCWAATVVVESGGEWMNPETGEVEPKVHLHWRLKKPASTLEELAALYEARSLAATRSAATEPTCPSSIRSGGPEAGTASRRQGWRGSFRWPINRDRSGRGTGEAARGGRGDRAYQAQRHHRSGQRVASDHSVGRTGAGRDPQRHRSQGTSDWEYWNKVGMTIWASTDGSEAGSVAFHDWSTKSPKYDKVKTEARWQHYFRSPPTKLGFGSLVYRARQHSPGWQYENPLDPAAEAAFDEFIASILRERDEADDADDAG